MNKYNNGSDEIENNHDYYYVLKKFKYLLLSNFDELKDKIFYNHKLKGWYNKHSMRKYILDIDEALNKAHELYSRYLEFNRCTNYQNAAYELEILLDDFYNSRITSFIEVAKTISHWKEYILNSFITVESLDDKRLRRLSNGPIEGINSKLEKININGNGYTNFFRFKNRVIYVVNKDVPIKYVVKK